MCSVDIWRNAAMHAYWTAYLNARQMPRWTLFCGKLSWGISCIWFTWLSTDPGYEGKVFWISWIVLSKLLSNEFPFLEFCYRCVSHNLNYLAIDRNPAKIYFLRDVGPIKIQGSTKTKIPTLPDNSGVSFGTHAHSLTYTSCWSKL